MKNISLIILAAGNSTRFNSAVKKQWLRVGDNPLWLDVATRLSSFYNFTSVVITSTPNELNFMKGYSDQYEYVLGGESRQQSLKNALGNIDSDYVLVTDVARSCVSKELLINIIEALEENDCVVPYLNSPDTVVYKGETIDRDEVKLIQTPQLSRTDILKKALKSDIEYTDDSSAIKSIGGKIGYILGEFDAKKLTRKEDIPYLPCLKGPNEDTFVGYGYDVHEFSNDASKKLMLGGIEVDAPYSLKAHSDGDVVIHALIDALLGGVGGGDIGYLFPDTDEKYKGADSTKLLRKVTQFIQDVGYVIVNCDITVMAQKPKLMKYKFEMRDILAKNLQISPSKVNVKATTTEGLGFVGREEGIAVSAVCSLKYYKWNEE